jgi:flagellar hook-associated protein 3 FlgL
MKVATNQYFNDLTRVLTEQHAEVASLQSKMAKGEKLLRPSEDPGAASKILNINSLISRQDSQSATLRDLDNRLVMEETAVSGMRDILMRIQELAVMGANDTYSLANRKVMAAEIRGYESQLLNLANTRNTDGGYLFAGTKNTSAPFRLNSAGDVTYQGDSTRVYLKGVGDQQLGINTTGYELFSGGSATRDRALDAALAFAEIKSLAVALENGDQRQISAKIGKIDGLRGNVELAMTKIGVRRNVIDAQSTIVQEQSTMLRGLLSEQKDLDYTAAVTTLSARMLALEAAQSTVSKISQLNLFNYLR